MIRSIATHTVTFVAACVLAITVVGCTPAPQRITEATAITKLAVMPLIHADNSARQGKEVQQLLDCQLSSMCNFDQTPLSHAEQVMTTQLSEHLADYFGDAIMPQAVVNQHFVTMKPGKEETAREMGIRLARELGADHVMIGLIWRFQQRNGDSVSSNSPASVAFNLYLLEVASGKLLWQGQADRTQEALSDNLFNASMLFHYGMKWLTAEELSDYCIQKALTTLPTALSQPD